MTDDTETPQSEGRNSPRQLSSTKAHPEDQTLNAEVPSDLHCRRGLSGPLVPARALPVLRHRRAPQPFRQIPVQSQPMHQLRLCLRGPPILQKRFPQEAFMQGAYYTNFREFYEARASAGDRGIQHDGLLHSKLLEERNDRVARRAGEQTGIGSMLAAAPRHRRRSGSPALPGDGGLR